MHKNENTDTVLLTEITYHALTCDEVVSELRTDVSTGLTTTENEARLKKHGPNKIPAQRQSTMLEKLWAQVNSILIYILAAGAIISFSFEHIIDGIFIIGVVCFNVSLGYFMENKAENATSVLKEMMSPIALVLRDNERQPVDSVTLAPGDIFFLQPGNIVPADGRVVRSAELSVLESPLTGESHPIVKVIDPCEDPKTPLAERKCMVYSGTHVIKGTATCVVVATGPNCEIGKISGLLTDIVVVKTPLILQLEQFGFILSMVIICLAVAAFGIANARGHSVGDGLAMAIGIAVAAIPEGLPACVTITFAVGVRAMANRHAIVKSLPAVETLGSVNVICSDKTGTLTKNVMTVKEVVTASGEPILISDEGKLEPSTTGAKPVAVPSEYTSPEEALLWGIMPGIFCNDGFIVMDDEEPPLPPSGSPRASPRTPVSRKTIENGTSSESGKVVTSAAEGIEMPSATTPRAKASSPRKSGKHTPPPPPPPPGYTIHGDPTETCLLSLGVSLAPSFETIRTMRLGSERISEIPFDSDTKYMATMHLLDAKMTSKLRAAGATSRALLREEGVEGVAADDDSDVMPDSDGKYKVIFLKGSPEKVVTFCELPVAEPSTTAAAANAAPPKPSKYSKYWLDGAIATASHGMRVLGLAYKIVPVDYEFSGHLQPHCGFTLTTLVGIMDPPRPSAVAAIKVAQRAGITVKMITGDHPVTALAIGKMLGLGLKRHGDDIESGNFADRAITGGELDELILRNMDDFDECVAQHDIFARTTPEHKIRIVQSLQRQGFVCSMTGDGVNDAPALKAANIGVAMGITGTEVAKDAAPVILTDDNFATIIDAVRIGRGTYNNLIKVITCTLPCNGGQSFSILGALIIGVEVPITALQVLWVNVVLAASVGIVLAFDKPDESLLDDVPRRPGKRLFGQFMAWRVFYVSAILTTAVIGIHEWELTRLSDVKQAHTVAVNCLAVTQMAHVFNCRNIRVNASLEKMFCGNKWMYLSFLGATVLQVVFTYTAPFNYVFGTKPIDGVSWGKILLFAVTIFLIVEFEKFIAGQLRKWRKKNKGFSLKRSLYAATTGRDSLS